MREEVPLERRVVLSADGINTPAGALDGDEITKACLAASLESLTDFTIRLGPLRDEAALVGLAEDVD